MLWLFCPTVGLESHWQQMPNHPRGLQRDVCAALPPRRSAIIGSHQLPHALADVDGLDLLGLEAEVAGPDS